MKNTTAPAVTGMEGENQNKKQSNSKDKNQGI
jgi:hypothetical protein